MQFLYGWLINAQNTPSSLYCQSEFILFVFFNLLFFHIFKEHASQTLLEKQIKNSRKYQKRKLLILLTIAKKMRARALGSIRVPKHLAFLLLSFLKSLFSSSICNQLRDIASLLQQQHQRP